MTNQTRISFRISTLEPNLLSMERLAKYLVCLVDLYGNKKAVHFKTIKNGSPILIAETSLNALDDINRRLQLIREKKADLSLKKAYNQINALLKDDQSSAIISSKKKRKMMVFSGGRPEKSKIISVTQSITIDGQLIAIGGKDDTVPVLIRDMEGKSMACTICGQEKAKELAHHYLGETLRITGMGKMTRHENGSWKMSDFFIDSYFTINDDALNQVFRDLRNVKENGWKSLDDPMLTWEKMRGL